jgi:hypothetical protein
MSKQIKVTIETENGIETFNVNGIIFTIVQDEIERTSYQSGYRGNISNPFIFQKALANVRSFILKTIGVRKEVEESFDTYIRETVDQELSYSQINDIPNKYLN